MEEMYWRSEKCPAAICHWLKNMGFRAVVVSSLSFARSNKLTEALCVEYIAAAEDGLGRLICQTNLRAIPLRGSTVPPLRTNAQRSRGAHYEILRRVAGASFLPTISQLREVINSECQDSGDDFLSFVKLLPLRLLNTGAAKALTYAREQGYYLSEHTAAIFREIETLRDIHMPEILGLDRPGLTDSRPPRLVVDLSIGGLSQQCFIAEKSSLPSAKDILRSYPIRNSSDDQLGLSIDIKSAHKRVAIRPSERGLVGFSWQNRLHFYRVCPFGATFSPHWWSRLGGFLLRLCHRMIYISHIGLLYVHAFIFSQSDKVLPISACLILLLFQAIKLPISWRKCEPSHSVIWIGWKFNFLSGLVSIPQEKQKKLLVLIDQLR